MKIREAILENTITNFLDFCKKELDLNDIPPIETIDEPCISGEGKNSFGMFDGKNIKVITQNRHPMDVMRTIAHELVHWKQSIRGDVLDGSDGSDTENTANAIAGIIMRKFSSMYPESYVI